MCVSSVRVARRNVVLTVSWVRSLMGTGRLGGGGMFVGGCVWVDVRVYVGPLESNRQPHQQKQRDKRTIAHKLHGKQEYVVFCKLTDIQVSG